MSDIKIEISKKKRFEFGRNWLNFVNRIDDKIISQAKVSLLSSLPLENLKETHDLQIEM